MIAAVKPISMVKASHWSLIARPALARKAPFVVRSADKSQTDAPVVSEDNATDSTVFYAGSNYTESEVRIMAGTYL